MQYPEPYFSKKELTEMHQVIEKDGLEPDTILSTEPDRSVYGLNLAMGWPLPKPLKKAYEKRYIERTALGSDAYVYPYDQTHITVLVTGGLGFIGSHIIGRLVGSYDIVVIDNYDSPSGCETTAAFKAKGIKVWPFDIADSKTWDKIEPCDFIFHGAAQTAAEKSKLDPFIDFKTNALGTLRVSAFARKHRGGVIYCNSIRVYDPNIVNDLCNKNTAISEDCPPVSGLAKETSPFAFSKYIGEQISSMVLSKL